MSRIDYTDLMLATYTEGQTDCWWLARCVLERMGVVDPGVLDGVGAGDHGDGSIEAGLRRAVEVPAGTAAQAGDVLLMSLAELGAAGDDGGGEARQHVGVCLDAFRVMHMTRCSGVAIVPLASLRRIDPGARVLRLLPGRRSARLTPEQGVLVRGAVLVSFFDDILTRTNRRQIEVWPLKEESLTLRGIINRTNAACPLGAFKQPLLAAVNGMLVDEAEWDRRGVQAGDEVIIAPRPADLGTGILIAIAVASAAASSLLISRVRQPPPPAASQRRFAFGRFSSDAVPGDTIPVFFGEHVRVGGKTIVKVPGGGSDGDTRIKVMVEYGRGPLARLGDRTADFDRVPASELTGIYFNDQPISNFPGVLVSGRMGTAGQAVVPGFGDTETLREVGVGGAALLNTSGADRTGASASGEAVTYNSFDPVNALIARVRFPRGLYSVSGSGQTNSRAVRYRYRSRTSDTGGGAGAWSAWTVVTVERADQSEFYSAARLDTLASGAGVKHDVQVERVSAAAASVADIDDMIFDSVQEVQYAQNTYAGKALLAFEITASEQLTSPPSISADLRGLANLRIWDGVSDPASPVFVTGYSANPAWITLALMTDPVWGAGAAYADADIDMASLFQWAVYADEAIDRVSGGGTRPRFACNLALRDKRRAIDWIRTVGRTGRCQPATTGNVWRFVVDRPRTLAAETFSDATIATDESGAAIIEYTREISTGAVVRPTRWVAQFANALREGREDTIGYPDLGTLWLEDEPLREESVRFEGVTDPEQVAADLIYLGKRVRGLARTVRFETTKQVPQVQPGDRFDLATSLAGWGLASGRVLAGCTTSALVLDKGVTLASGVTYVVRIVHDDGTVEDREVSSAAGGYDAGDEIELAAPLAFAPAEFAEYVIGQEEIHVKPFVCTRVALVDLERMRWEIAGVEYDEQVYDDTPGDITLPDYSTLRSVVTAPGPLLSLVAEERLINGIRQVVLAWRQAIEDAENTGSFRIYRRTTGTTAWVLDPDATPARRQHVIELADLDQAYEFRVVAVSIGGAALSPADPRHPTAVLVYGLSAPPPPPPTGLGATSSGNTYTLTWTAAPGAAGYQVLYGGDAGTGKPNDGAEDCMVLARVIGGSTTTLAGLELAPGLAHRFWVRSQAGNGRLSETAATVLVASAAAPSGETIKQTRVMNLSGEGTNGNTEWSAGESRLVLTNPAATAGGSWTSPEITPGGGVSLTELTLRPATANDADDPAINTDPFRVPSVAADQWGVVTVGPPVVGMLMPPWPDNEQTWLFEVRTHDGSAWGAWETLAPCASIRRAFGMYQVRVTMSRRTAPYRPALRGLTAVLTH